MTVSGAVLEDLIRRQQQQQHTLGEPALQPARRSADFLQSFLELLHLLLGCARRAANGVLYLRALLFDSMIHFKQY